MCTLTYTPLGKGQFILGSNRDESVTRAPAGSPKIVEREGLQLLYPMDPEAQGSWIASSEQGRSCCLLNGAFETHEHKPPYRKSRGLVLLDAFMYDDLQALKASYDLEGIEPFNLVSFDPQGPVSELRWDGVQSHYKEFDAKAPRIWCSAMLYSKEEQLARLSWFNEWKREDVDQSITEVEHFHTRAGDGIDTGKRRHARNLSGAKIRCHQDSQRCGQTRESP